MTGSVKDVVKVLGDFAWGLERDGKPNSASVVRDGITEIGLLRMQRDAYAEEIGRLLADVKRLREQRDDAAQLVRDMLEMPQWSAQPWAKMALTVAVRAIERGRHWTPSERLDNLMDALTEDALAEMEDEDE